MFLYHLELPHTEFRESEFRAAETFHKLAQPASAGTRSGELRLTSKQWQAGGEVLLVTLDIDITFQELTFDPHRVVSAADQ
ncbi:hypothetical protein J6590_082511 [Homalodisca vitripennis]|nr:hypothetical protein J6590_082511 [Homalodisca vitripennis]